MLSHKSILFIEAYDFIGLDGFSDGGVNRTQVVRFWICFFILNIIMGFYIELGILNCKNYVSVFLI